MMRWKVFINSWVVLVALTSKNNSIGTAAENSAGLGLMMDRRPLIWSHSKLDCCSFIEVGVKVIVGETNFKRLQSAKTDHMTDHMVVDWARAARLIGIACAQPQPPLIFYHTHPTITMAKDAVDIHFEKINKRFPSATGTDTSARAFRFLGELHQHYLLKLGVEEAQGQFLLEKAIMEEEKAKDVYEKSQRILKAYIRWSKTQPVRHGPPRHRRYILHLYARDLLIFILQYLTPPLPFRRTMRHYTTADYEHRWV